MEKIIKKFERVRTVTAIGIAVSVGFILILLLSSEPLAAIYNFTVGPLTKTRYIGNIIETAIPLIFSGLAFSLLFSTQLFNMGAEGLFYISGLIAAIVGIVFEMPSFIHSFLAIAIASIISALIMGIIGVLKAKWDTSELVTSLMFNSILYGIGLYILNHYFRESNTVVLKSVALKQSSRLAKIITSTRIHSGLIIAIIAVIVCDWLINRTKLGYEIRMTGSNDKFAEYSGINVKKIIIIVSLLAGLLAGIGGSVEVLGMYDSFKWVALPGLGFDGALVAMLAKNKPRGVALSALFLAYIRIGADLMSRLTDIPSEMVGIMQGLIILMISGKYFIQFYKNKLIMQEVEKQ